MFVLNVCLDALNANHLILPLAYLAYLEHMLVLVDHAFFVQLVVVLVLQILHVQHAEKVMILQTIFAL